MANIAIHRLYVKHFNFTFCEISFNAATRAFCIAKKMADGNIHIFAYQSQIIACGKTPTGFPLTPRADGYPKFGGHFLNQEFFRLSPGAQVPAKKNLDASGFTSSMDWCLSHPHLYRNSKRGAHSKRMPHRGTITSRTRTCNKKPRPMGASPSLVLVQKVDGFLCERFCFDANFFNTYRIIPILRTTSWLNMIMFHHRMVNLSDHNQ